MKNMIAACIMLGMVIFNASCEKDEGLLPAISFKTGGSYISSDTTISKGTMITIGINASKTEDKDVLKKFNISKSVNNAAATTAYSEDLDSSEGDNFTYDFTTTLEDVVGQQNKYTFTITNRDGLVNQVLLTVTIKE